MKNNYAFIMLISLAVSSLYASEGQNSTKTVVLKQLKGNSTLEISGVSDTESIQTLRKRVASQWEMNLDRVRLMCPGRNLMMGRYIPDDRLIKELPSQKSVVSLFVVEKTLQCKL